MKGVQGPVGPPGLVGREGPKGDKGKDGLNGLNGIQGELTINADHFRHSGEKYIYAVFLNEEPEIH